MHTLKNISIFIFRLFRETVIVYVFPIYRLPFFRFLAGSCHTDIGAYYMICTVYCTWIVEYDKVLPKLNNVMSIKYPGTIHTQFTTFSCLLYIH